jgi:hypothetical protein
MKKKILLFWVMSLFFIFLVLLAQKRSEEKTLAYLSASPQFNRSDFSMSKVLTSLRATSGSESWISCQPKVNADGFPNYSSGCMLHMGSFTSKTPKTVSLPDLGYDRNKGTFIEYNLKSYTAMKQFYDNEDYNTYYIVKYTQTDGKVDGRPLANSTLIYAVRNDGNDIKKIFDCTDLCNYSDAEETANPEYYIQEKNQDKSITLNHILFENGKVIRESVGVVPAPHDNNDWVLGDICTIPDCSPGYFSDWISLPPWRGSQYLVLKFERIEAPKEQIVNEYYRYWDSGVRTKYLLVQ